MLRARTKDVLSEEGASWSDLLLSEGLLVAVQSAGFAAPSPVQLRAIPLARLGTDLIIQAKNGTGKTAVFVLSILQSLNLQIHRPQAVVLAPTRELALQVCAIFARLGRNEAGLRVTACVGGLPISRDRKHGKVSHVLVATPGRLCALLDEGSIDCTAVRCVVLDEADHLLGEQLAPQVVTALHALPQRRQTLVCSASFLGESSKLALARFLVDPQVVNLAGPEPSLLGVRQFRFRVATPVDGSLYDAKLDALLHLLAVIPFDQAIVFSNHRSHAAEIVQTLCDHGWAAVSISGEQTQGQRNTTMRQLRRFELRVLVSTDLLARGVDVEHISFVVNFDLPPQAETYLHRVGRTGRFGMLGVAISLVSSDEEEKLNTFERELNCSVPILDEDGVGSQPKAYFGATNAVPEACKQTVACPPTERKEETRVKSPKPTLPAEEPADFGTRSEQLSAEPTEVLEETSQSLFNAASPLEPSSVLAHGAVTQHPLEQTALYTDEIPSQTAAEGSAFSCTAHHCCGEAEYQFWYTHYHRLYSSFYRLELLRGGARKT